MSLIKDSIQRQIDKNCLIQFKDTTGTILDYDRTTNTCKLKYHNPNGDGYLYRGNVNITNNLGGVATGSIRPGQRCNISFINSNVYEPVITGISDSYYQERSNTDQGAYLADDDIYKVGTPEHIVALNLDWINDNNSSLSMYETGGERYTDFNVNESAMDLITTLDKYENDEVGLTNLSNKSTIKVRDNGDIDLFVSNNVGIRICKKTGNIKIYGADVEFTNIKTETTDKSISTQLKVAQIMKICLAYDIIKEVDLYVSVLNDAISGSTDVNGDYT